MKQALIDRLRGIAGEVHVLTSADDCIAYEEDWRGRYKGRALCVVRPDSTEEVSAVVRACVEAGVAMVPQGGNTGLVGGGVPRENGDEVVISLQRLQQIRRYSQISRGGGLRCRQQRKNIRACSPCRLRQRAPV